MGGLQRLSESNAKRSCTGKFEEVKPCARLRHCSYIYETTVVYGGTAVTEWLRYCATNQKVAGSIPDGVIGIFR
jgi:hypothetical protein